MLNIEQLSQALPLAGATIAESQSHILGAAILAVRKKGGTVITSQSPDTLLEAGDELVVIGSSERLRVLEGPPQKNP